MGRYAWNDFADRSFNPAVGCSRGCDYCWARRFAGRGMHPCLDCKAFKVHDHFERWAKFRAKAGERIALAFMGDLFDPGRKSSAICDHIAWMDRKPESVYLLQTRHVRRAMKLLSMPPAGEGAPFWPKYPKIELGTSFCGPEDIANVRALGELPPTVVRFVAFEPCDSILPIPEKSWRVIREAKPNWAYIGPTTGPQRNRCESFAELLVRDIAELGLELENIGCKVIYKRSCGPDLYARNEGVTIP